MAKKETEYTGLSPDTLIEVVAIRKTESNIESITVAEMTIEQFQNIKKKPDFIYRAYQKGFSQFKTKPKP